MTYAVQTPGQDVFVARRRDTLLGYQGFASQRVGQIEGFEIVTKGLGNKALLATLSPEKPMMSSQQRAWDAVNFLRLEYSAGANIDSLRAFYPTAMAYLQEYADYHVAFHLSHQAGGRKVPHLDLHDVDYSTALYLASFAILLGHTRLLSPLTSILDYENDDLDGLLERLVAPFVPGRAPPPDTCTRHLPYFKLLKVFAAAPDKRPELMSKYMDEWYTASRREPYFESHKKGREHSYLGLWSFEAAAVTYVLQIDDGSYRDMDFYPRDLVDYARSRPLPPELGGPPADSASSSNPSGLRCQAGQPCPRTGWWVTPAKAGSRRRFEQGDTMPAIGGDYGTTIWQWDDRQAD